MIILIFILGLALGYVLRKVTYVQKVHGEIFVIEKKGQNPEVFVGIEDVDDLLNHDTVRLKVRRSTR